MKSPYLYMKTRTFVNVKITKTPKEDARLLRYAGRTIPKRS